MGLPGSGKTTLARSLVDFLASIGKTVEWYNADQIRSQYDDWDFSHEGRVRQSTRMKELAEASAAEYVVCDFVAPLAEMRNTFDADYTIWMDTVVSSEYEDTNQLFVAPKKYNFCVSTKDSEHWVPLIVKHLLFLEQH
jgi:adenylylsulfate kinase